MQEGAIDPEESVRFSGPPAALQLFRLVAEPLGSAVLMRYQTLGNQVSRCNTVQIVGGIS